ncbi:hypothetical protein [Paractinoplanes durhamensis]|uniref:MFS transporter n=1 Tax=Paractinoplanes durhamensis TaxID=113563 RepID=A0ABQ3YUZ0_9ACTN|nr:hypothetical protein [Actinoplanes durhamensis]GIE01412.1 hypothetical protein Adu01nite_27620 [Actinoplanes durhamensis]
MRHGNAVALTAASAFSSFPSPFYHQVSSSPWTTAGLFVAHSAASVAAIGTLTRPRIAALAQGRWALPALLIADAAGGLLLVAAPAPGGFGLLLAGRIVTGAALGFLTAVVTSRLAPAHATAAIFGGVGCGAVLAGTLAATGLPRALVFGLGVVALAVAAAAAASAARRERVNGIRVPTPPQGFASAQVNGRFMPAQVNEPLAPAPLAPAQATAPLAPAQASLPLAPAQATVPLAPAPLAPAQATAPLAPAQASLPLAPAHATARLAPAPANAGAAGPAAKIRVATVPALLAFGANGVLGLFTSTLPGLVADRAEGWAADWAGGAVLLAGLTAGLVMLAAGAARLLRIRLPIAVPAAAGLALFTAGLYLGSATALLGGGVLLGTAAGLAYDTALRLVRDAGGGLTAVARAQWWGQVGLILPVVAYALLVPP